MNNKKALSPIVNPGFILSSIPYENLCQKKWRQLSVINANAKIYKYINNVLTKVPAYIDWKDIDSNYIGCSHKLAVELANLKAPKEILGKADIDLIWGQNVPANYFKESDKKVLAGFAVFTINKLKYFDQTKIVIIEKIPFLAKTDSVAGIISYVIEISYPTLSNIKAQLNSLGIELTPDILYKIKKDILFDKLNLLSEREQQCLYYILRNLSAKEIAKKLDLSYRTVESYITSLKDKFNCINKTELIIKALKLGYIDFIPEN